MSFLSDGLSTAKRGIESEYNGFRFPLQEEKKALLDPYSSVQETNQPVEKASNG
jgi:hypothetical protein